MLAAVALVFGLTACGESDVALSCWGTVALIVGGQQVNPKNEEYAISIAVDITKKTMRIDDVEWPIFGDVSRTVIVALAPNRGTATLNRVTGAVSVHFIESDGLTLVSG
jgi:hypothetical protein